VQLLEQQVQLLVDTTDTFTLRATANSKTADRQFNSY
jgi:hypothetical protein